MTRRGFLAAGAGVVAAFATGAALWPRPPRAVTLWHVWSASREALMRELLAEFARREPGIAVEAQLVQPDLMRAKVVAAVRDRSLPDVVGLHTDWFADIDPAREFADLSPAVADIDLERLLLPRDLARNRHAGRLVALPNTVAGAMSLAYLDLPRLRAHGIEPDPRWTFDSFTSDSARYVRAANDPKRLGVAAWDPFIESGHPSLLPFAFGAGEPTVSADGRRSRLDAPGVARVAAAIDRYVEEVYGPWGGYRGLLAWRNQEAGIISVGNVHGPLARGVQGILLTGSWAVAMIRAETPDLEFAIRPLPGLDRPHGGIACNAWSYALRPDAAAPGSPAVRLARWLTVDPAGNGAFCRRQLRPCPIAEVNRHADYTALGAAWGDLQAVMAADVPFDGSVHEHVLTPWWREVPVRRVAGEPMAAIMEDIHQRYQAYLDGLQRSAG